MARECDLCGTAAGPNDKECSYCGCPGEYLNPPALDGLALKPKEVEGFEWPDVFIAAVIVGLVLLLILSARSLPL